MTKLEINLNGKTVEALNPTMGMWRRYVKLQEGIAKEEITTGEFFDAGTKILALVFGISQEEIDDGVNVEDLLPTLTDVRVYMNAKIYDRLVDISKNAETVESKEQDA